VLEEVLGEEVKDHSSTHANRLYRYEMLSDRASLYLSQRLATDGFLEALENYGVVHQLQECQVEYGGLRMDKRLLVPNMTLDKWDWYSNTNMPEPQTFYVGDKLNASCIPNMPLCYQSEKFPGMFLSADVCQLTDLTVYRSKVHNSPWYDRLAVNQATKEVFMLQVSTKQAKDHAFKWKSVKAVLENLQLLDNSASESPTLKDGWTVHYIYVMPDSLPSASGVCITGYPSSVKIKSYVVRARLEPSKKRRTLPYAKILRKTSRVPNQKAM